MFTIFIQDKLKTDTADRDKTIELLRSQNKALEFDKTKFDIEIKDLKQKLANATTAPKQPVSQPQSQNANIQKPESAVKDPVYNLLNAAAANNNNNNNNNNDNKLEPKNAEVIAAPPSAPKPSNSANQIVAPPEPKKDPSVDVIEDKMKVAESKQNLDIIDPDNMPMDDDMEKDDGGGAHGDQKDPDSHGDVQLPGKNSIDNSINYEVDNPKNAAQPPPGLNDKNPSDNLIDSIQQL